MDNKRALSVVPKLWQQQCWVGEHSVYVEGKGVSHTGGHGKANVGISNDNAGEKPALR